VVGGCGACRCGLGLVLEGPGICRGGFFGSGDFEKFLSPPPPPPRILRFSLASPIPPILHTHISSPTGIMEL